MEFFIAQGISVLNGVVAVTMMQFKSMKKILVCQIISNLLTALTYILLGGLSGAGICLIAIVQSVLMFVYNVKKIPPHRVVIVGFILLYIGCSAFYYKSPVDIFSALAAVCYAFSIVQTKSSASRFWYLFNPVFWMIYDFFTQAYGNFILHLVVFVSTVIAILRNDVKGKKKADR